jgi:hypothetical protein
MQLEDAIAHCLSLPDVVEDTRSGPEVLVFKEGGFDGVPVL